MYGVELAARCDLWVCGVSSRAALLGGGAGGGIPGPFPAADLLPHFQRQAHRVHRGEGERFSLGRNLEKAGCGRMPLEAARNPLLSPQVFEAMVSWIKHEEEARLSHMPKLMEHVRLPLLSRAYLVQVWHVTEPSPTQVTCCPLSHEVPGLAWAVLWYHPSIYKFQRYYF